MFHARAVDHCAEQAVPARDSDQFEDPIIGIAVAQRRPEIVGKACGVLDFIIIVLLDLLGRRWALRVLWELRDGRAVTFRELQALCGGVSASVLNDRLRELRDARVVAAEPDGYQLTADGLDLVATLAPLQVWV